MSAKKSVKRIAAVAGVAAVLTAGAAPVASAAQLGGSDGGASNCTVKEQGEEGKEYKYMVDTCQFIGGFGLNSLVHGAVLGKEVPKDDKAEGADGTSANVSGDANVTAPATVVEEPAAGLK
ncbi:hypothetical protein [Streptomyces boninensis]|uniref:hypothetical protein n=1 Tax=Streptomyces boninensis TaxID=2039455 RepID=UPI003B21EA32